jgi:hypothetical protein
MKRKMPTHWLLVLGFFSMLGFFSCEKSDLTPEKEMTLDELSETKAKKNKRAFKAQTKTRYRFAPILGPAIPVTVEGVEYDGTAFVPGDGFGHATHMGKVMTYFNQLSYIPKGADPTTALPAGSLAAPIADIPSYPFFLPPPPPGQPIDFTRLTRLIRKLPIPAQINGHIVNTMFVNMKNEAVFGAYVGQSFIRPESPTRVVFGGKGVFVGGTGKFECARGEFDYLGYFNPQNQDDADYNVEGWIKY